MEIIMKVRFAILAAATVLCTTLAAQQQPPAAPAAAGQPPAGGRGQGGPQASPFPTPPVRVFLYGGLKTHGEGQHDYPQFVADWSKLLMNRNAIVDGALHFPSAKELASSDVLVIYKGDAGYMSDEDKANMDAYLRHGGGVISIHDSLCGPDPEYFSRIVGGAKKHGETNFTLEAKVPYTIVDKEHPITKGMSDFMIEDEAFYLMTWAKQPQIHVLATAVMDATDTAKRTGHAGEVVPQIWTYENQLTPAPTGQPFRAFAWMQGHNYSNFSKPEVRDMLLRAIAWTGKRTPDTLMTERPQRGGGGRRGTGAEAPAAPGRGRGGA